MTDPRTLAALLPGYDIGAELGRGGYGVVLAGTHRQLGRAVAIKELPPGLAGQPGVRARFLAEARVLAGLDHPHVVPVYDFVEQDGVCALVMEALPGGTVWDRFTSTGYSPAAACAVVMVACAGLQHAHAHGILHRDVKPENLLLTETGQLKVADFGIAKVLGDNDTLATSAGEILGTPAYIAPEQAQGGQLGPQADVYAAGVMLYELLSGTLPFSEEGGGLAIVYRHVYEQPTPLHQVAPEVPPALADVVMRALAREPSERFASAEEFGVAIGTAAGQAYGAGWFEGAGVPVLGGGPILASTQPLPGQASGPPAVPTVAVRATRPTHVQGSAGTVTEDSVVPVRQILVNPPRPVGWAAATAVLVGLTAVVALSPPATALPRRGAVVVNGVDAADRPFVDLSQPFTVRSGAPRGQATVTLTIAGVPLVRPSTTAASGGGFRVDARGSRYLATGTVLARITRAGSPTTVEVPLRVKRAPFTSVPGVAALVALLVVLAYAESQLAPLRRRGRRRTTSLVGLALAGGALGALGAVFTWLLGSELLTTTALARSAAFGAAAGVLLGITTYKAGRRARLRRIARIQGLTPR